MVQYLTVTKDWYTVHVISVNKKEYKQVNMEKLTRLANEMRG